jgi:hypothetical protein
VAGKGAKGAKQQGKKGAGGGNKAAVTAAAVAAAGKGKKESGKGAKPEVVKKLTSAEMDDALDSYWVKVITCFRMSFLSLFTVSFLSSVSVRRHFFLPSFSISRVFSHHSLTHYNYYHHSHRNHHHLHTLSFSFTALPLHHWQAGPKGMDTLLDRYMSERPKTAPAADGAAAAAAPAPDAAK